MSTRTQPEQETDMTAQPTPPDDGGVVPDGLDNAFIQRLAARVPAEDVEAGRAQAHARWERARAGERQPNDAATREDIEELRTRLAVERAEDWRKTLPSMYRDARVSDLAADQHPDKLRAWWKSGARILYLRSAIVGNGKTHAAYSIANGVCDRVWVAGWIVADFLATQREYDSRAWRVATRCDLLILDDLGQEVGVGWEKEKARETLHRLLDLRARHGRRTIITTNRDGAWMETHYGAALADRLIHDGLPLEFTGPSRREVRDWGDL